MARQDAIRADVAREATSMGVPSAGAAFRGTILDPDMAMPWAAPASTPQPEVEPQLFLSWGRATSRAIAEALKPMLDERLPGVEVFFSPTSIEPGDDPSRRMFDEGLLGSSALLVVLTARSAASAYVIWETATAWARDQLVIPIFVDIEPQTIPGPLKEKVQGVHLHDRTDIDRGIKRLCTHFGLAAPDLLTDAEYAALLDAAQTPEEVDEAPADENALPIRLQLRGFVAEWQAMAAGLEDSYSPDDWKQLASQIRDVVLQFVRISVMHNPADPLGTTLGKIAQDASKVTQIHVMLDGGASFRAVTDGARALIAAIEDALQKDGGTSDP